jgi:long-chain acyl-CoA synthetase
MLRVTPAPEQTIWRVEDNLVDLGAVRPLGFFARNAHRYSERWKRVAVLTGMSGLRVLLYATSPVLSCRVLHLALRGMSRDRLDILGEEYFETFLKPRLKRSGVERLQRVLDEEGSAVLISQGLEHVVRPLARHLGIDRFIANRLEMRDGSATGRLLEPIVHSRGGIASLASRDPHGRVSLGELSSNLGVDKTMLRRAIGYVDPPRDERPRPVVLFPESRGVPHLSVRESLAGKHILLIGVTGFIGKVWLEHVLSALPEVGRVHLLIRSQRSASARQRFERMVAESPVFDDLHARFGDGLGRYLAARVEIVEGDISKPDLGIDPVQRARLLHELDVIVNSSGLTDFNPDLRSALAINVDATMHLLDFLRNSDHAALLHLSTCYVVGDREGRVRETIQADYVPRPVEGFDAEVERRELHRRIHDARQWPPNEKLVEELAQPVTPPGCSEPEPWLVQAEGTAASTPTAAAHAAPENGGDPAAPGRSGSRFGWLRRVLSEAGMHRSLELGWPNAYAFTKSLGESQIERLAADLPVAVVRPSIVETSLEKPFEGWNEGINTSAPLSWLLGTTFRQLPANERKCLDVVPVDLVCRGMTLVAAALVQRRHHRLYQMATSVSNPCNMKRFIELTSLAHRVYYRGQAGYRNWWKARMEAIPVSKRRYQRLSAPRHQAIVARLRRLLSPMPFKVRALKRVERAITRVAKLVEIYEPFILKNEHVFETENVRILSAALPESERGTFAYEPETFDWRNYWINIHIPAMRKWCYPLIEGRTPQTRSRSTFRLPQPEATVPRRGVGDQAVRT